MQSVASARALKNQGLEGDRYAKSRGFWQMVSKPKQISRDVSLINHRDILKSNFNEAETRRNIIVLSKIELVQLIGQKFFIGEVLFRGIEECTPCKRPSELAGKPDFAIQFKNSGGLRAEVLSDGWIRQEDEFFSF